MLEKENFQGFELNTQSAPIQKDLDDGSLNYHSNLGFGMGPLVLKSHNNEPTLKRELRQLNKDKSIRMNEANTSRKKYLNLQSQGTEEEISQAKTAYIKATKEYFTTFHNLIETYHAYKLEKLGKSNIDKGSIEYVEEDYRYHSDQDLFKNEYTMYIADDTSQQYAIKKNTRKVELLCEENKLAQRKFIGDKTKGLVDKINSYNNPKYRAGMAIAELPQDALETMYLAFGYFMKQDMWESQWIIDNIEIALKMIDLYEEVVKRQRREGKAMPNAFASQVQIDKANSFMEKYSFHVKTLLAGYGINDIKNPVYSSQQINNIDVCSLNDNWMQDMRAYDKLYGGGANIHKQLQYKNDAESTQKNRNMSNERLLDLEQKSGLVDSNSEIEGLRDLTAEKFYKRNRVKMIDFSYKEQPNQGEKQEVYISAREDLILCMAGYKNIERINWRLLLSYYWLKDMLTSKDNKVGDSFEKLGPMLNEVYDFFKNNYKLDAEDFAQKEQILHIKLQYTLMQAISTAKSMQEKRYIFYLQDFIKKEQKGDLHVRGSKTDVSRINKQDDLFLQSAKNIVNKIYPNNNYLVQMVDLSHVPLFLHEPNIKDIAQNDLKDCVLLGELGGIAARNPQAIKNCMHDNGDGTVTVRLFDQALIARYVTVKKTAPAIIYKNGKKHDIASRGALWVQMMEKAYAYLYNQIEKSNHNVSEASKCNYKNLHGSKGVITRAIYGTAV